MKIIEPHKIISEPVNIDSAVNKKFYKKCIEMADLCWKPNGIYKQGGYALAHCQVEEKKPLTFFVTREREIIINPEVLKKSVNMKNSVEGCMSYNDRQPVMIRRHKKLRVRYWTIIPILDQRGEVMDLKIEKRKKSLNWLESRIWQHELQHFEGKCIYDK